MAEILLGSDTHPGGRKYNEDRGGAESLVTPGGLRLAVAVVCDGVGGEERGERAAQLAIDSLLADLRASAETEVPQLLTNALKAANSAVFAEATRLDAGERMACTMALAVIVNEDTLYVANAGDSRIYLCRASELQQLTRDHIFAHVMVWLGKLSPEAAASNPDANRVMRVLGTKDSLQVDLGIYLTTTEYGDANRLGRNGLALQAGDSILVCSDGLIKNTATTGQPLVSQKEIVNIFNHNEGLPAARAIMSLALGRIPVGEPVDNITVSVLQTEDPARVVNLAKLKRQEQARQQRKLFLAVGAVSVFFGLALIVVVAIFGGLLFINQRDRDSTATRLAEITALALAQTQTVAAYSPTPTLTPSPTATPTLVPTTVPTLAANEIAKLYDVENFLEVLFNDRKLITAPPAGTRFIAVNHNVALIGTGNLHLLGNTQLQFSAVVEAGFSLRLFAGSQVFFNTGPYPNGASIELAEQSAVLMTVKGCVALNYVDHARLTADCYSGECAYSLNFGTDTTTFNPGEQIDIQLDASPVSVSEPKKNPQSDNLKYWKLLNLTSAGRSDIKQCAVPPPSPPTPTRTVSPTPLPPAATPTLTPPPGNGSVNATPVPPPANTTTPQPSNTVPPPATPQPSDTVPPPTSTTAPTSTNSPLPPTNTHTPIPPSATPLPTTRPPTRTNIPLPSSTNTSAPIATDTPVPTLTDTPPPAPTS